MKGAEFKKIREQLDLTQDELADVLCLSGKTAVSNIETGFRNPSKLAAVVLWYLDKLPKAKSRELQLQFKNLGERFDFEKKRKS